MRHTLLFTGLLTLLTACNGKDNENKASAASNSNCRREKPAADEANSGGCRIRLVTPAANEEIDLTDGKTYEFAWTNDGTTCELPYHAYIGGNPLPRDADGSITGNISKWDLNANEGQIGSHGGFVRLRAEDLEGLTSCDGTYEWVIESFHGSHPASQVFKVRK